MNNQTYLVPKVNTPPPASLDGIVDFGIPGFPSVAPIPAPPIFSQGEDVVYDGKLFLAGQSVTPDKFTIQAIMKKSQFSMTVLWKGLIDDGVYYFIDKDTYQLWIPSAITSELPAGTYWIDLLVSEKVGQGVGVKDRTAVILTTPFELRYTMSSPHPDSDSPLPGVLDRSGLEPTYPNLYSTISPPMVDDDIFDDE